ncbi:MAG: hypothetical protein ACLTMP_03975 [Eggerthella lenta]
MGIKDGFVLRDVAGQTVVIATGDQPRLSWHGEAERDGSRYLGRAFSRRRYGRYRRSS